ncbi:hypothetical protein [Pontibacillus halophilus]|nr:hypothetical protein [Pontibacillus halophilus]
MGYHNKWKFLFLSIGPISLSNSTGRLTIEKNVFGNYLGGFAGVAPPITSRPKRKSFLLFYAGGPLTSLLFFVIGLVFWLNYDTLYLFFFMIFNLILFVTSALPYKEADGGNIVDLIKDPTVTERYTLALQVTGEMLTSKRPKEWDETLIHLCEAFTEDYFEDFPNLYMFLFYYYYDYGNLSKAITFIETYLKNSPNDGDKLTTGLFYSVFLSHKFIFDRHYVESVDIDRSFLQHVSKVDSVNYYRVKAIQAYLRNDIENTELALEKSEKSLTFLKALSIYRVEKQLTQSVRNEMKLS